MKTFFILIYILTWNDYIKKHFRSYNYVFIMYIHEFPLKNCCSFGIQYFIVFPWITLYIMSEFIQIKLWGSNAFEPQKKKGSFDPDKMLIERKETFESIQLNLIMNAKFNNKHAQTLLNEKYKPDIIQKFKAAAEPLNKKIQYTCDIFFAGIIREFEQDFKINIPLSIIKCIQKCFELGAADFYEKIVIGDLLSSDGWLDLSYLIWRGHSKYSFVMNNKQFMIEIKEQ